MHLLPLLYVLTGVLNVLLLKWSDTLEGECSDGKWRRFQHPLVQVTLMFLGEFLCFVIYKIAHCLLQRRGNGAENENPLTRGEREFSPISLLLPAALDAIASLMLFTGLYLTYASSYSMLQISALIFVGLFSSIHMNQALIARHWMAMFTIACGITVILSIDVQRVWYDRASLPNNDPNAVLTGNLLIVFAQIFHSAQFVYEEKHLKATDVPALQAAGWQGIFGLAIVTVLGVCLNFLPTPVPINNNTHEVFDDLRDVFMQIYSNGLLVVALSIFIVSYGCYKYTSLSIAKFSSTANRLLADGLVAILVWLMALLLEWEILNIITMMAFVILQMGIVAYRNAIFIEWYRSLMARMMRRRYSNLTAEQGSEGGASRPADVI